MRWKSRLVWLGLLILLWLFCSGTALADTLVDRLSQFPNWQSKPIVQPSKGDLVYPEWFAGEWIATTTLIDLVAPLAPDITTPGFESNRKFLNQPISFKVRFTKSNPSGLMALVPTLNPHQSIVSDRAFNGQSLAEAYLGDRAILAVKVDPHNPNRQITLLQGNRQLASTVTARAIEAPTPEQFVTSELFQQEFLGTPQVYFNEVENTTAYTHLPLTAEHPEITADQATAIYLSPQDPDYFKTIDPNSPFSSPRPVALYRYQMEFRRSNEFIPLGF